MEQLYLSEQIQISFSSVMLCRGFWEPSNHDFGDFQVKQHT